MEAMGCGLDLGLARIAAASLAMSNVFRNIHGESSEGQTERDRERERERGFSDSPGARGSCPILTQRTDAGLGAPGARGTPPGVRRRRRRFFGKPQSRPVVKT